jgi:ribosomal protein L11 methyltransferase
MPAPDRWLALTARVPTDAPLRELLGEGMLALGGHSVLDEGETLTTYLAPPADLHAFLAHARHLLADWLNAEPPELSWSWRANEDWERVWRRGLRPRKVSPRIVVKPSWARCSVGPDEVLIEIDPQMAFGTGEHATTRGCLRLLDAHLRPGDRVLDIGSGSAILSIAAARLGAGEVLAVEHDADANLNARENLARNGLTGSIELLERRLDPALLTRLGRFDLIVANILSSVIRPLLPALACALRAEGRLIVAGVLSTERDDVVADAAGAGLTVRDAEEEEGWWSGVLGRA